LCETLVRAIAETDKYVFLAYLQKVGETICINISVVLI